MPGLLSSDLFRIPIYESIRPLLERLKGKDAAEVSGRALQAEFDFPMGRLAFLTYPEFDLTNPGHASSRRDYYDLVLADQVLEHVKDPELAIGNLWSMLKVGGYAVLTTVFMFPAHDLPGDYWRFSAAGLRELLTDAYWEDVHTDGWGNREALLCAMDWEVTNHDPTRRSVLDVPNDPKFPIVTWAWGRKRAPA